jgi:LPS sulfotransferase NodH
VAEHTKFVIAGTQRTGTTLLRTSLSSHPEIDCHGEVFKLGKAPYALPGGYWAYTRQDSLHRLKAALLPQRSFRDFLAKLYGERGHRAVGFKLMLNHCEAMPDLWPLVAQHDVKVILVTRRNFLKTLVSRQTAAATGVYHVSASLPVKTAVANWVARPAVIDAKTVVQNLDTIAQEVIEWKSRLGQLEFIELIYETYVQDQPDFNAKVLDFLEVPKRVLDSDLKKVNPDRLRNLLANYDEIADVVRRSPYSFCLDTDD